MLLKVLQIVPHIGEESSGPSYSVPGLCRGLAENGVETRLDFLGKVPERLKSEKYTAVSYPQHDKFHLGWSSAMLKGLREACKTADIIHDNSLWMMPNVYPAWAVKGTRCKLVVAPRGTLAAWSLKKGWFKKKVFGWLLQNRVLRRADMFHATSEKEYEEIRALGYKQPVAIVPIGMDIPELKDGGNGERGERGEDSAGCARQRALAEKKVAEWLNDVTQPSFEAALERRMAELIQSGELRLRNPEERALICESAKSFYTSFSRCLVELSDGRFVYFAPDPRSRLRKISNSQAWAEYAIHGVTNGGDAIPGTPYHMRWYNHRKVENADLIVATLKAERCYEVLRQNPNADAIKFFGTTHTGGYFDVVARLDEFGNAMANMTEVTFEASKERKRKYPQLKPLAEAVQAVVCHQAAGTNPQNATTIPNSAFADNPHPGFDSSSSPVHRVVFFGRLHKVKAVDRLVRAWEILTKEQEGALHSSTSTSNFNSITNWELVIAGPDGGIRSELEQYIAEHKIPRVRFVGEINGPAKYEFLADADLYVLPSHTENFAVTVAEALACGTPVIVSKGTPWQGVEGEDKSKLKVEGEEEGRGNRSTVESISAPSGALPSGGSDRVAEILSDGATGPSPLADAEHSDRGPVSGTVGNVEASCGRSRGACGFWVSNDPETLAKTLIEAMSLSDAERRQMGEVGREWIRRDFSWEGIGAKMKAAYEWLLDPEHVAKPEWVKVV